MPNKRGYYHLNICFIYYLLFYANPLPSSIPPPLNLHNMQVDDCIADDEEILIKGGQVDVLAEEVEEDVGVDLLAVVVCKKYEEPKSCGSAANFLLGVEMGGDPPGRMEVEGDALMAFETDLFLMLMTVINANVLLQ